MNSIIIRIIYSSGIFLAIIAVLCPDFFTKNTFLVGFINYEILNILAVMVTITTAAAAQLHLALNDIEKDCGRVLFRKTRKDVRENIIGVIAIFLIGLLLLIVKPWLENIYLQVIITACMLMALLISTLLMYDIVACVFQIPAFSGESGAKSPKLPAPETPSAEAEKETAEIGAPR